MLSRNRLEATISLAEDEVAVGGLDHRLSRKSGEVLGSMCSLALDQQPKPPLARLHRAPLVPLSLQPDRHVPPAVVTRHHRRQQRPVRRLRPRRNFETQDGPESAWAGFLSGRLREHMNHSMTIPGNCATLLHRAGARERRRTSEELLDRRARRTSRKRPDPPRLSHDGPGVATTPAARAPRPKRF